MIVSSEYLSELISFSNKTHGLKNEEFIAIEWKEAVYSVNDVAYKKIFVENQNRGARSGRAGRLPREGFKKIGGLY